MSWSSKERVCGEERMAEIETWVTLTTEMLKWEESSKTGWGARTDGKFGVRKMDLGRKEYFIHLNKMLVTDEIKKRFLDQAKWILYE